METEKFIREHIRNLLNEASPEKPTEKPTEKLGKTGVRGRIPGDLKQLKSLAESNPQQLLSKFKISPDTIRGTNLEKAVTVLQTAINSDNDMQQAFSSTVSLSGNTIIVKVNTIDLDDGRTVRVLKTAKASHYIGALMIAASHQKVGLITFNKEGIKHDGDNKEENVNIYVNFS